MHIFLYGPSGSGKSTIGKLLAQSLDLPFLDLDAEIEKVVAKNISILIFEDGEKAFRDIETEILGRSVVGIDKVIALGGGTLLRKKNRTLVENVGQVFFLDTNQETLFKRLSRDANKRPLLDGNLETSLKKLLKERQAHYASFPKQIEASDTPAQVVWNIQRAIGRFRLRRMGSGYDAVVLDGGLDHCGEMLKKNGLSGSMLLVSDTNVAPLYAERVLQSLKTAGLRVGLLVIPAGESNKSIETISLIWQACLDGGLDRKSTIISLGGGVVSDQAGFSAATYMRGCRWVVLPTTLLAMVDASIGGKTGFDLPEGKNLIGAFYPPQFVLADPVVLSTLPDRELRAGLSEVVKHGVIADPDLFDFCSRGWERTIRHLPELVRRGLAVKAQIIEEDPYEQNIRASLNYGHTIGHAVEVVSNFDLLHGEAVAIGMVIEARLAERMSIACSGLSDRIAAALSELGLPIAIPQHFNREDIILAMKKDKKKSDGIVRFALPRKIGEVEVDIAVGDLSMLLEEMK